MPAELLDDLSKREILRVDGLSGDPFGVAPDGEGDFFVLHLNTSGAADLYHHAKDGVMTSLVHAAEHVWRTIGDDVAAEFNQRLRLKNVASGSWSEAGGNVRLHWQFGRELEILMHCAGFEWAGMRTALVVWKAMDPARRFACWKKWKDTIATTPEWQQNEIVRIVHTETNRERVAAKVEKHKTDILYAYIVEGDQKALDDYFPDRAMTPADRMHVKRLGSYNYAEDVSVTLARTKLLKAAKDRWAQKRAQLTKLEREAA